MLATGLLRSFSCDRPLVSSPSLPKSTHCALISHLRADWEGVEVGGVEGWRGATSGGQTGEEEEK